MKNENEPRIDDIVVSPKVLADTLGITDRQIRNLAEQGIVEKTDKGRYLFKSSVKAYITLLKVAQRSKEEKERFGDSLDLEEEKAKHEVLKREITEIRLQLIKGNVHRAEDVERVITDMFIKFRSKMQAMPAKLAKRLENKGSLEIQEALREEIGDALNELADYNAVDYYSDDYIEVSDKDVIDLADTLNEEEENSAKDS